MEAKDRFWPDANNGTADVDGDTARDAMVGLGFIRTIALSESIYRSRTHLNNNLYNIVINFVTNYIRTIYRKIRI